MKNSEFWVMLKKRSEINDSKSSPEDPGYRLPSLFIVELTRDEIVYLWPYRPRFDSLCLVCENLNLRSLAFCKGHVPSGYPCNFKAVPEAELNQDLEDFLIDGEFICECGYFYSFNDFRRQNNYSDKDFFFYRLGEFPSIRFARNWLLSTYQKISQFMK